MIVIWDNWSANNCEQGRREMSPLWRQSIGRHNTESENAEERMREIQSTGWGINVVMREIQLTKGEK